MSKSNKDMEKGKPEALPGGPKQRWVTPVPERASPNLNNIRREPAETIFFPSIIGAILLHIGV